MWRNVWTGFETRLYQCNVWRLVVIIGRMHFLRIESKNDFLIHVILKRFKKPFKWVVTRPIPILRVVAAGSPTDDLKSYIR